jgi:hypothetical protein
MPINLSKQMGGSILSKSRENLNLAKVAAHDVTNSGQTFARFSRELLKKMLGQIVS